MEPENIDHFLSLSQTLTHTCGLQPHAQKQFPSAEASLAL